MKFERSDRNVGNRVVRGALYLAGARFILRLFSLVNLVMLGRLLASDDYGVAALAITVIAFTQVISDMRVNSALISLRDIDASYINTGFTMNLLRGVIMAVLLFAFAGPIAGFMKEPRLEAVLQVISIVLVFDGMRNPAFMMYQRNIDFSKEFRRRTAAAFCGSAASVAVAVVTRDYWAIVAGTLAGRFTEMAFSYWRIPHQVRFSVQHWKTFLGFGSWLTLSAIISQVTNMAPRFLTGRYLGADLLGFYMVGRDTATLATRELASPLTAAVFPGLSALARNNDRLRKAYRKAQSIILGISLPIGVGTALMANELIAILVGEKWLPLSATVVMVLAPISAFGMISSATDGLAMAKLATRAMFNRAAFVAIVILPVYFYAATEVGFMGVLYAVALRLFMQPFINMFFAKTLLGDSFFSPFYASWRSLVAAAAMAAVLLAVPAPFRPGQPEYQVLVEMLPRVLLGAGVYVLVHLVLWQLAGKPDGFEAKVQELAGKGRARLAARLGR
jgi:PST family polysaccharide transporter